MEIILKQITYYYEQFNICHGMGSYIDFICVTVFAENNIESVKVCITAVY